MTSNRSIFRHNFAFPIMVMLISFLPILGKLPAMESNPSMEKEIQNIAKETSEIVDMSEKINKISLYFLTRPYGNSPTQHPFPIYFHLDTKTIQKENQAKKFPHLSSYLIEKLTQVAPAQNFDKFDCMTYVESVLALSFMDMGEVLEEKSSLSAKEQFQQTLNYIRYQEGIPTYAYRNHFVDLDWTPKNLFFRDVTQDLSNKVEFTSETRINRLNWMAHNAELLADPQLEGLTQEEKKEALRNSLLDIANSLGMDLSLFQDDILVSIPYVTLVDYFENTQEIEQRIPQGSILNIVRPNWDLSAAVGTHMNISHQGFVFHKEGKAYFRHATSAGVKQVVELPLKEYLEQFKASPTLKGFNILKVED